MIICRIVIAVALLLVGGVSPDVSAQAMTVFGANNDARACYRAALVSARTSIPDSEALKRCDRALGHGQLKLKNLAATYINRGVLRVKLGHYKEALDDYQRAENLQPDLAETHVNRGNVFYLTSSFDDAVAEYSRALELDIDPAQIAHVNRGMSYEKLGDISKAEADYRRAVELAPQWSVAQTKLESLLARQQKLQNHD